MKEKFSFYYDEPDFEKLWEECIFVFDTNVLLNLYRYPKKTSQDLITMLENEIKDRLWLPYQVALEYQEGRYEVIQEQQKFYKRLKGKIKDAKNSFNQKINSEGLFEKDHYYLKPNTLGKDIKNDIGDICSKYLEKIDDEKSNNHNFLSDDIIQKKLDELFNGDKLGDKFPEERLVTIFEEGQTRYVLKIPPGHGDNAKSSPEKFGDLIIWNQIIEYSKTNQKPIIFITEDSSKEDWLIKFENNLIPRKILLQEFFDETEGQFIYIYDFKDFMSKSEEFLGIEYSDKTKEDVQKLDEYNRLELDEKLEKSIISSKITSIVYDSDSNNLTIKFDNLDEYYYYNVPEFRYTALISSDSKEQYFNKHIQGRYHYIEI
jgi:hypothetical protein